MKNPLLKISIFLFFVASIATNCNRKKDDDTATSLALLALIQQGACLEGEITTDRTISGECNLRGTVFVKNGATLTIEAGSKILGEEGSSLFILPGSKIVAVGTATNPIVFTSAKPEGKRKMGDWGGITIIGKAPIEDRSTIPTTEGTDPQPYGTENESNDNSGTLKYVRIEFAGYALSVGNELNSLSLYAVGKGTTIEYVQSHFGLDDAIEIFGGRVEPKYLLLTGTADDDVDIDEGYFGTIEYVLAYRYRADEGVTLSDDPRFFEIDGAKTNQNTNNGNNGYASLNVKGATNVTINYVSMRSRIDLVKAGTVRDCAKAYIDHFSMSIANTHSSNVTLANSNTAGECNGSPANSYTSNNQYTYNNNSFVTTEWKKESPDTPPVFIPNTIAFPGGTNWTTGWTIWRNN